MYQPVNSEHSANFLGREVFLFWADMKSWILVLAWDCRTYKFCISWNINTVSIGYSNLGYSGRTACSNLDPQEPEVLEGLVSTSKWPRNEAKFLASSRPRPRKTRIKSLVLKMAEKKAEIPRNSSSRPRKGRGKGRNSSPRLVLNLEKILPKVSSSTSSSLDDPSRTSVSCQNRTHSRT